jgi:hypothetical protein
MQIHLSIRSIDYGIHGVEGNAVTGFEQEHIRAVTTRQHERRQQITNGLLM